MFRIRTITNDLYPRDKAAIEQVKQILVSHFPAVDPKKFDLIPEQMKNPLKYKFSVRDFVLKTSVDSLKGSPRSIMPRHKLLFPRLYRNK
jgi:hypothetical protein